jgi:hypothetical protein
MKSFVAGLVVLIAGMGLGAQEAPIALRESSWPETGLVTEMRAIHDLRGGVYIPYIAEGSFRVLRAGAGGKLDRYMPEGFDGGPLEARSLKAISEGSERYVAFIGRSGGDSIYLFGFGFWDALSYCPLGDTNAEAITDYSLVSSKDGVMVYTLSKGLLRSFSAGIRGDAPRQIREISRPGEFVEAFEVRRERDQEISYGWYRVAGKDYWEIHLFSLDEAGNLVVERTGLRSVVPRLEYGVSPEGKAVFTIIAGGAVSVCHAEGLRFARDANFEAPFKATRYIPALLTGGPVGLLIGETEETELLYGVSYERSGAPALKELFAAPAAELLSPFFVDNDRISLLYRSGGTLRAALLRAGGGIVADGPLPAPSEGAALFRYPPGETAALVLPGAGPQKNCALSLFQFEGAAWRPAGETLIPGFFPAELYFPLGLRNRSLFLLVSAEALALYEPANSGWQALKTKSYARSLAYNGVVCLAVSSENGIALYRIGE